MIAITGANGNLGKATIQFLLQKVAPTNIIAIVRNRETVNYFKEQGIIIREADYNDTEALNQALKDVSILLQVSTKEMGEIGSQQEKNVVFAAKEQGVNHIVYTSSLSPKSNAKFLATQLAFSTEKEIMKSGIHYTFFRNSMYMEAIPELIGNALQTNEIRYPSGSGNVSFVSRNDIAEAIANVLSENSHQNRTFEITGYSSYTFDELARMISAGMKHIDISDTVFKEELKSYGMPVEVVDLLVSMANGIKSGEFSYIHNTLEKLLGRKPLDLKDYLKSL